MMPLNFRTLKNKTDLVDLAATIIASRLQEDINIAGTASLLVSGGSTPGPVYEKLAETALPWDKVKVGLVDERWVDEKDTGSNAAFIRRSLLQGHAAKAGFTPMKTPHKSAIAGQATAEKLYQKIPQPYSAAVLGMGADGHTASWFPQAGGLELALSSNNEKIVQAITANPSDVTGPYLERMSITRSALNNCKLALLLITGMGKYDVFQMALAKQSSLPVRAALDALGGRLIVLWAP